MIPFLIVLNVLLVCALGVSHSATRELEKTIREQEKTIEALMDENFNLKK
ncbi:MAG TPA: hypothetical protein PK984_04505 [Paludibacteraceae bacterium]|nr:hypothetical protein [Paludibacteraceae bacterium]HOS37458.1 hypothetical protein [Paludibacteraceae bacterium]HPK20336.1 hypothetical protein [Paludibacteraceae bacterium]